MIPRPYQNAAREAVQKEITSGKNRILVVMGTGLGKSLAAALIAKDIGRRTLVLCDRDELFWQLRHHFEAVGLSVDCEKADMRAEAEDDSLFGAADVVVSTFQTMQHRAKRFEPNYFKVVVVDEAHTVITDNRLDLIRSFGAEKIIGITATAFRNDLRDLNELFDAIAFQYPLADGVKDGWLVPILSQTVPISVSLNEVKTQGGDFSEEDLHAAIRPHLIESAKALLEYGPTRKTIAFFPLIDTSKEFVQEARNLGIRAEHIDGNSKNRAELIADLNAGKIQVLCNANLLTYGTDIPAADCVLMMRPTKSTVLFHQMVGRISRTLKGTVDGLEKPEQRREAIARSSKQNGLILDPVWMRDKHDLIRSAHLVCKAEDHAKRVTELIEKEKGKPCDLDQLAQRALNEVLLMREGALRKELEKNKHKGARLVDAIEWALSVKDERLSDQGALWGKEPPTEKQLSGLANWGIDPLTVRDKGHASQLMDALIKRKDSGLANPKQIKFLRSHGHPSPAEATFEEASSFMDKKLARFKQITYFKNRRKG